MKIKSLIFKEEKCVFLIDIDDYRIKSSRVSQYASEDSFNLKREFHITIIGNKEGKKLISKISTEKVKKIKHEISELDWSFEMIDKFYHIKKQYDGEVRESIIQIVKINNLEINLRTISEIIGQQITIPFLHITLFTKNDKDQCGIGIDNDEEFINLEANEIFVTEPRTFDIEKIYLPSRIQIDTIVAIFFLQKFGTSFFKGIDTSLIEIVAVIDDRKTYSSLLEERILAIDHAEGPFDHHKQPVKITSSRLVASYLNINKDPAISKMLAIAERCDFYGKGTLSNDILDKTFGLSGMVTMLNQKYHNNPRKIYDIIFPLLDAHYDEEKHRSVELPLEITRLMNEGKVFKFEISQRGRIVKVIMLESDDNVMSSYLRSGAGGSYDVVAQWLSSGHINIITKQIKGIHLESLVALIRKSEIMISDVIENIEDMDYLASSGRIKELVQWYYDQGTNTLQNGGINPAKNIVATKIPKESMIEILKLGLSEILWRPK